MDADNKGFVFSEDGYKGNGTPGRAGAGELKQKKREKQVDKLNQATKEVNDLVQDIKADDDEDEGDAPNVETQPQKK